MGAKFVISRHFDATPEKLWQAWTLPAEFGQWFGPKGFHSRVQQMELRPGGILHSCLISPDGHEMWAKFIYREVEPPHKLVWEHGFSNKDGERTRHPGHDSWPLNLLTTLILAPEGGKTKLTLTWEPLNATPEEVATFEGGMDSMNQGWGGTFEQLTAYLARA